MNEHQPTQFPRWAAELVAGAAILVAVGLAAVKFFTPMDGGNHAALLAKATLTGVAVAVQCYQMAHHRLSDSLDDLTKKDERGGFYLKLGNLKDPWGQRILYSHIEVGFTLGTTSPNGETFVVRHSMSNRVESESPIAP